MAVTAQWYGLAARNVMESDVNFAADTIKCALLADTYIFDKDLHQFFADVSADEVTGTGYTAGGETITTPTVTYDAAADIAKFDGDDVAWLNSTITARFAVVYVAGATAGTDDFLLGIVDFGANESSSSGDFTITWSADGILRITT